MNNSPKLAHLHQFVFRVFLGQVTWLEADVSKVHGVVLSQTDRRRPQRAIFQAPQTNVVPPTWHHAKIDRKRKESKMSSNFLDSTFHQLNTSFQSTPLILPVLHQIAPVWNNMHLVPVVVCFLLTILTQPTSWYVNTKALHILLGLDSIAPEAAVVLPR